jgi:hypothetical protein
MPIPPLLTICTVLISVLNIGGGSLISNATDWNPFDGDGIDIEINPFDGDIDFLIWEYNYSDSDNPVRDAVIGPILGAIQWLGNQFRGFLLTINNTMVQLLEPVSSALTGAGIGLNVINAFISVFILVLLLAGIRIYVFILDLIPAV